MVSGYLSDVENFDFGKNLKEILRQRGMTQKNLAEISGLSQQTINRWCAGHNSATVNAVRMVKRALGCTWEELMGE